MSQSINDECLGCETGCDYDGAHRDDTGNYHPACGTKAAQLEQLIRQRILAENAALATAFTENERTILQHKQQDGVKIETFQAVRQH